MTDYIIQLLNFCLTPFRQWNNIIVMVPTMSLLVSGVFALIVRILKGVSKWRS